MISDLYPCFTTIKADLGTLSTFCFWKILIWNCKNISGSCDIYICFLELKPSESRMRQISMTLAELEVRKQEKKNG